MPTLSAVYRNVAGTIGASLGVQLALLVNGIATARLLGVLDRGNSALLLLLATVLPIVVTFGLPLAITYWIARDPSVGRRLILSLRRTIVWQLVVLVSAHACVLYVVFHHAAHYVQYAAALSLLLSPSIAVWGYGVSILQASQQFRAFNLSRMLGPAIIAALAAAYLIIGIRSLFLVTLTWVIIYWMTAVITAVAAWRGLPDPDATDSVSSVPSLRTTVTFGLKALLGSVTPVESFQPGQAMVGFFVSKAALGIYVAAVAFTSLPRFLAQSIGVVAYPYIAAQQDPRGPARSMMAFMGMTLLLCGVTVGAIEVALPFLLPFLFGAEFKPAVGVSQVLLISALLFGLRRVLTDCARGAGRPGLGSVAEAISLACLVPAALLFGSSAKGVAFALVLAAAAALGSMIIGLLVLPIEARRPAEQIAKNGPDAVPSAEVASPN